MKPKYRSLHSLHLTAIALSLAGFSSQLAHAANRTWSGASSSVWATSGNWNTLPIASDTAIFNGAGNGNTTIDLGMSGVTIKSVTFDTASAAAYTIGTGAVGSQLLTLGDAGIISVTSLVAQNQLINANVALGSASASTYTFSNGSTKNITFAGSIQGGTGGIAGAKTLTLDGLGTTTVSGAISNGGSSSLAIIANSGLLTLSGINVYTGGTTISGGIVQVSNVGNQGSITSNLGTSNTLKIGTSTSAGTLRYTGEGETSNRIVDLSGANFGATLDASGSGLFKLTSDFIATGAGDKTLTLKGFSTGEIGGKIVDNSGANITSLTKAGSNTWTLSNTNTYTGLTDVQAGTLAYGVNNAIASGAVQVSGGTLDLGAFNDSVGAVTLTSGNINGNAGILTGTSYALQSGSVRAILAGTGALTKSTAGTVTLSNANTYSGITTISAGVLSVSSLANGGVASNLGQSSNAAANLVLGGGTLQYTGATVETDRNFTLSAASNSSVEVTNAETMLTFGGASTNTTGGLIKIGVGKLILGGMNLYTGLTDVQAGTLAYGVNNAISSGAVQISGGTLDLAAYSDTVGAVTLASGNISGTTGTLNGTSYGVRSGSIGAILAGTGTFTKTTTGTVTLFRANIYTGLTDVQAGTLAYGVNDAIASGAVQVSGGTLDLGVYNDTVGSVSLTGGNINSSTGTLTGSSFALQNGSVSAILAGSGALTKSTVGTVTLSGTNTYTGVTSISAGVLSVSSLANGGLASGLGQSSNAAANWVLGGGTLQYTGATSSTDHGFTLGAATTSSVDVSSADTTLTLNGAGAATSGSLKKIGDGTLKLSALNAFTGSVSINAGTLSVDTLANGGAVSGIGASTNAATNLVLGGGKLQYTGASVSTDRKFTLIAGTTSDIEVVNVDTSLTLGGGGINTSGSLNKTGAGKLILSAANAYTGLTDIQAGTLAFGIGGALAGGNVRVSGGTLDVGTFSDTVGALTLVSGSITGSTGILTSTSYNMENGSISAILGGGADLTKTTSGTVTLGSANTYSGTTSINVGTLSVAALANGGVASGIGASTNAGNSLILGGGTLRYTGASVTSDRKFILTAGTSSGFDVQNADATLTMAGANGAGTVTTGGLNKIGAGTLILSAANGFTGLTDVQAGTLAYGISNMLSTGAVQVSGGTLDIKTFTDTVGAVTLASGSINGTTGVLTGTSYSVRDGSISAILAGTGVLTKTTVGTVTLSGTNTYSGGTNLNEGVLALNSSGALGTSGSISFSGGTLQYSSNNTTDYSNRFGTTAGQSYKIDTNGRNVVMASGLISSGGTLNKAGAGTLTINGISTYTGKTTVSGGTLAIGSTGSIANTSEVSLAGGNFNVSAVTNYTLGSTQSLTGSGSVTGDLAINGTMAIGASPGTITFNNNLTLGLGSVSNFEFTSGSFDAGSFDFAKGGIAQTVSFGGILNLYFKPEETFAHGTSVKIFDFGNYTGNFTAVNVNGLTGNDSVTFDSSTGTVMVVPEPGAMLLGGLGLLALLRRRRR